jgi:malate/lactate dehydrogenase
LLELRTDEIIFWGGVPDPNHQTSLQQAINRVKNALDKVIKHCACYAGAAAAIAAAEAALEAGAPTFLKLRPHWRFEGQ